MSDYQDLRDFLMEYSDIFIEIMLNAYRPDVDEIVTYHMQDEWNYWEGADNDE